LGEVEVAASEWCVLGWGVSHLRGVFQRARLLLQRLRALQGADLARPARPERVGDEADGRGPLLPLGVLLRRQRPGAAVTRVEAELEAALALLELARRRLAEH